MNQIAVITTIPDFINSYIENTILKKARDRKAVSYQIIDLRDFGIGNYKQIDDKPYGGGKGMILMSEPLFDAIDYATNLIGGPNDLKVIYPNPSGEMWNQKSALKLSRSTKSIIICGHYKGIDQRVVDKYVTNEYSVGDFVMTSGEIPAMVMIDSIVRLMPGALKSPESAETDSFSYGLLDHPHYTHPRNIKGLNVPDILLSGNHNNILKWRLKKRQTITKKKRTDLWELYRNKLNYQD
ncbi:MAG: tRNA (guanosine(37)-N1)-methyltransferase TrmD [Candidatus Marinimicrobia bacterium]|nr:tRNA (guanosine(37)-N1)-methyltransferase TrmD [Candidatus Neomarinimicrobiota bacterium]